MLNSSIINIDDESPTVSLPEKNQFPCSAEYTYPNEVDPL